MLELIGRFSVCSAALSMLVACASTASGPATSLEVQVSEIQETVFRHLISQHLWDEAEVICISVGGEEDEVPADLLQELGEFRIPVVSSSECEMTRAGGTHLPTGKTAQQFSVVDPEFLSENQANVRARYFVHGRHAGYFACELEREDGSWQLRECVLEAIA